MRLITDILRDIRKGRPVEEATMALAGSLKLGVQLHRTEHVRQAVFKRIVLDVADRTKCQAVFGKSEN